MGLETHILSSSETGLSSVTTLIVGTKAAALIDPPFLVKDANAVVDWIKTKTKVPLKCVFVTHHRQYHIASRLTTKLICFLHRPDPDHYFSANPILDAFPESKLYAVSKCQMHDVCPKCVEQSVTRLLTVSSMPNHGGRPAHGTCVRCLFHITYS
jgi:glyoxylase-like metal-dependent hydrolase (beta-lactamase superfamily II)